MKDKSEIVGYLKANVGLFAGFTDERLGEIVDGSRVQSFEANEAILHYGARAAHLGVVLGGVAAASVLGAGGRRQTVGRIEAGGTFGEMALMTGDAMLADIIAESRCEVLLIPVSLFQSVIVAEPGAVQYISRTVADRFKALIADPSAATAALVQSSDPYGLSSRASGRRRSSSSTAVPRLSSTASTTPRMKRATPAAWSSASAWPGHGTSTMGRAARSQPSCRRAVLQRHSRR